jgi:hypothetical protein
MRSSKRLFNDIGVARQVATLVHRQSAELNTSLAEVERECSADEFSRYRTAVATIMGAMFTCTAVTRSRRGPAPTPWPGTWQTKDLPHDEEKTFPFDDHYDVEVRRDGKLVREDAMSWR